MFYTGKGDGGISDMGGGKKVPKTHPTIAVVGTLDELNSLLGLVRNTKVSAKAKKMLRDAQEKLFIIQAQSALTLIHSPYKAPTIAEETIHSLEQEITALEKQIKPGKHFIIPGATEGSAWLDYARTVARRAELAMVALNKNMGERKKFPPTTLAYLNRLSSLLYALARFEVKRSGKKEDRPRYK